MLAGEQVRLIDGQDHVPAPLVGFGGERRLDLGNEVGGVEAGGLAEGLGDGTVDAPYPDLGVGQVDEGVAGGVQAVGGGAQRDRLPGADFSRQDAEAAEPRRISSDARSGRL